MSTNITIELDRDAHAFTVKVLSHALAVYGEIPLDLFDGVGAMAKARGYDLIDTNAAEALGATFIFTDKAGSERLREEVEAAAAAFDDPLDRWLAGGDTGVSSRTIAEVLSGRHGLAGRFGVSEPLDPDDLGRCIRLLDKMPGWRERLGEVAEAHPGWLPLVERWAELEALYREEAPSGEAPRCYALMDRCRGVVAAGAKEADDA